MTDPRRNTERDINRFDDIFHQYGDDTDDDKDTNVDFDNLYMTIVKDNYDKGDDDVIEIEQLTDLTVQEEEHLSQKLSQLSASAQEQQHDDDDDPSNSSAVKKRPSLMPNTTTAPITKKMKSNEETKQLSSPIPKYLSSNNKAFDQMMTPLLQKTGVTINIEYFRQIALLIHEIESTNLNKLLWTAYLRSGTSTLKSKTTTTLLLWPIEVKSKMIAHGHTTATDPKDIDQESCVNYVSRVLQKFENQTTDYQAQLKERKQRLNNRWTSEIEEAITKFVLEYGIALDRIPVEGMIATIEYDYNDRLIQLEYYQQNPNEYQKQIFEDLARGKRENEIAKLELAILKQRILYNHLPKSFDTLQIPAPISLDTISDGYIRQRLMDRCEKILQRTKSDMMMVYITTAEAQMNENQKKFDDDLAKMKENQRSGQPDKKLTQTMLDILERRFKNTNERLICLYKLKLRFFAKAPTVKN